MNVQKYLDRIQYKGRANPEEEVLENLQMLHLLNVPFENLDIHYGNPISLDINRVFIKVVENKRGGFCYELNGLFYELLIALGFRAKRVSARVFDGNKNNYGEEFDHLAILVEIDGNEYLTDVGFGEFAFKPLILKPGIVQEDRRGNFVVEAFENERFRVSKWNAGEWKPEYIFSTVSREPEEFCGMCTYHQTNPNSPFTQKRLISKPTKNGRITISGHVLKITEGDDVTLQKELNDEHSFADALFQYFGLNEKEL